MYGVIDGVIDIVDISRVAVYFGWIRV
jgi:hypothetical protein